MSNFQLKSSTAQSTTGTVIYLTDTTGVYNASTNPTGYGASQIPANSRRTSDIQYGAYYIKNLNTSEEQAYTTISLSDAQNMATGTVYNILSSVFKSDDTFPFDDSVYYVKYKNAFTGLSILSFSEQSSGVIVSGDITEFIGAKYINFTYDTKQYILEIASVDENNSTITLVDYWTEIDTDIYNYYVEYESESYLACSYNVNKCIQQKIAKVSIDSCTCSKKQILTLSDAVILLFSIDINMDKLKYQKVNDTLKLLTYYCSGNGCNCN